MCRFIDAGRCAWQRPFVWLPVITWAALTPLVYWLMPQAATLRFDLVAANLAANDPKQKLSYEWNTIAVSPDGHEVVTSNGENTSMGRLWNVKTGALYLVKSPHGYFSENRWPPIEVHSKAAKPRTLFVHRDTDREISRTIGPYVQSRRGNLVAYKDGNTMQLLDLDTDTTRRLTAADASIEPQCFSDDDQLLAGLNDEAIVIVDVKSGEIRAKLPYQARDSKHLISNLQFAPNGQSLVWHEDRSVVVCDLADEDRFVIQNATFVNWHSPDKVLTAQRNEFQSPTRHIELWDWRAQRRSARWEAPGETRFVTAYLKSWAMPPEIHFAQSHDARQVLFAGFVQPRAPAPWLAKLREWLRLPSERQLYLEVFLLDGDTLDLKDRWKIPAQPRRDTIVQFTEDGEHVVYADGHVVEYWPVPSRSWLTSVLWAGGGTSILALIAILWRAWRYSKRVTIGPPPSANAPEVSHAKK